MISRGRPQRHTVWVLISRCSTIVCVDRWIGITRRQRICWCRLVSPLTSVTMHRRTMRQIWIRRVGIWNCLGVIRLPTSGMALVLTCRTTVPAWAIWQIGRASERVLSPRRVPIIMNGMAIGAWVLSWTKLLWPMPMVIRLPFWPTTINRVIFVTRISMVMVRSQPLPIVFV